MTYLIVIILLLSSGLFAGLILGLMSLEPNALKRKAKLGDSRAAKIYPLRRQGNLLLVTLILANVGINTSLAIFLDSITSGLVAGLLTTALITIFGEILPQSVIPRFALSFGARTAGFVRLMMMVLYPVCKPIAWVLDKTLGEELPMTYSRKELIEILEEHGTSQASDIKRDEERIAGGALTFGLRKVRDAMTPRSVVVGLVSGDTLDQAKLDELVRHGYSRFPVVNKQHDKVTGILYAYSLIGSNPIGKEVDKLCDKRLHYLNEGESLDTALNAFLKTKQHLFIVVNQFLEYTGIITLEDVLEEIVGEEIVDEFDEYSDLRKVAAKLAQKTD